MSQALLEVNDLSVRYQTRSGWFTALRDVSLSVAAGGSLGIVGESGSGKSTLALALLGLLPKTACVEGSIRFDGQELVGASARSMNRIRGKDIGLVYQDALVSLNPVRNVGGQITEVVRRHRPDLGRAAAKEVAVDALSRVGIPNAAERYHQFPHEFSGGMRQRAAIAMALAAQPRLLVADEVTTALDVTVQAQILDLLLRLRGESGMSTIVVSHDLDVVRGITDDLVVVYAGRMAERGFTKQVLTAPRHPYTAGLVQSAPTVEKPVIAFIPGTPPTGGADIAGCPFAPRCSLRKGREICLDTNPPLLPVHGEEATQEAACHFSSEMAGGLQTASAGSEISNRSEAK